MSVIKTRQVTLVGTRVLLKVGPQGPAGAGIEDPDFITFVTAPVGVPADQGTLSWNTDELTLDLLQNGTTLQLGQEQQYNVRNDTGSLIADGTPVMATGTIGASSRITVAPMDGTDVTNAKFFLGVATEDIANGADGKVTEFGKVRAIDTSAWTDSDVLWISPTVAGELVNVQPTAPAMAMPVAFVIYAAVSGSLFVRVNNLDLNAFETFSGTLSGYTEDSGAITITTGAGTVDMATTENIRTVALVANTTITVSNLVADKALTLIFNTTAGPFTVDLDYGAKTIAVTMNGAAGAQNETLEILNDGTDLFVPTDGTVLWTVGA